MGQKISSKKLNFVERIHKKNVKKIHQKNSSKKFQEYTGSIQGVYWEYTGSIVGVYPTKYTQSIARE